MQVMSNEKLRTEFLEFCMPTDEKFLKAAQEIEKSLSTAVKAEKEKDEQKLKIKEIIEKFMSKSPPSKSKNLAEPAEQSQEMPAEPEEQEKPDQTEEWVARTLVRTIPNGFYKRNTI